MQRAADVNGECSAAHGSPAVPALTTVVRAQHAGGGGSAKQLEWLAAHHCVPTLLPDSDHLLASKPTAAGDGRAACGLSCALQGCTSDQPSLQEFQGAQECAFVPQAPCGRRTAFCVVVWRRLQLQHARLKDRRWVRDAIACRWPSRAAATPPLPPLVCHPSSAARLRISCSPAAPLTRPPCLGGGRPRRQRAARLD